MDHDDTPIGRLLSRREVVALLGVSGVAVWAGARVPWDGMRIGGRPVPPCVVRPQQTEGPYFVDEKLNRSDIRSNPADGALKAGIPLSLIFSVSRINRETCVPLANALVDVWQCDAEGVYSDVQDPGFDTVGQKFLRGYQVTDAQGNARFTTIYPGWYPGRAVHIHFKIRTDPAVRPGLEFTSQVYFDETLTDRVHARAPYAKPGQRRRNRDDRIFTSSGGEQLVLDATATGEGYAATFAIGLASA